MEQTSWKYLASTFYLGNAVVCITLSLSEMRIFIRQLSPGSLSAIDMCNRKINSLSLDRYRNSGPSFGRKQNVFLTPDALSAPSSLPLGRVNQQHSYSVLERFKAYKALRRKHNCVWWPPQQLVAEDGLVVCIYFSSGDTEESGSLKFTSTLSWYTLWKWHTLHSVLLSFLFSLRCVPLTFPQTIPATVKFSFLSSTSILRPIMPYSAIYCKMIDRWIAFCFRLHVRNRYTYTTKKGRYIIRIPNNLENISDYYRQCTESQGCMYYIVINKLTFLFPETTIHKFWSMSL